MLRSPPILGHQRFLAAVQKAEKRRDRGTRKRVGVKEKEWIEMKRERTTDRPNDEVHACHIDEMLAPHKVVCAESVPYLLRLSEADSQRLILRYSAGITLVTIKGRTGERGKEGENEEIGLREGTGSRCSDTIRDTSCATYASKLFSAPSTGGGGDDIACASRPDVKADAPGCPPC